MIDTNSLCEFWCSENSRAKYISDWIHKYSWSEIITLDDFIENQKSQFTLREEYWLVNRIDNATSWMLYFTSNSDRYRQWSELQKLHKIKKHYYAVVSWNIWNYFVYWSKDESVDVLDKSIVVKRPLMHHIDDKTKMIALIDQSNMKKWRWNVLYCESQIDVVYYNEEKDQTLVHVVIHSWKRHQIRVHCASLWHHIIWDSLYNKKDTATSLHLRSIWVDIL